MIGFDVLLIAVVATTPLLLAIEGELVVQRSGIINLGIEGLMLFSALGATIAAANSGSAAAGLVAGIIVALAVNALFGALTVLLRADQIVTGTAVNLLALGITGVIYGELQRRGSASAMLPIFDLTWLVVSAWTAIPLLLFMAIWKTRFGLRLRAAGENPDALRATGHSVVAHRAAALAIQAVLAGLAGAHLALALSNGFAENMTAGRGFIALAIVIFGRWKVPGAVAGAAIFGLAAVAQYQLQAANQGIPFHLLLATPYVVTLVILAVTAGRVRAPQSLGR